MSIWSRFTYPRSTAGTAQINAVLGKCSANHTSTPAKSGSSHRALHYFINNTKNRIISQAHYLWAPPVRDWMDLSLADMLLNERIYAFPYPSVYPLSAFPMAWLNRLLCPTFLVLPYLMHQDQLYAYLYYAEKYLVSFQKEVPSCVFRHLKIPVPKAVGISSK